MGDTSQPDTGTMISGAARAARDRVAEHVTAFNEAVRSGDWPGSPAGLRRTR
ncbi:MAG: hypothetical protein ACLP70_12620 [Streptosporangiaceae bacterium]|jgi:hypothetical protein